jgi:catechol 2,3-dioxygenase-like lactoylglutathione lyase family enzyme
MADRTAGTQITEVATILVPVSDQDRAIAFYVGKLGFRTTRDHTFGSNRWVEVAPPGGATTTLALAPGGGRRQPGVDTGIRLSTDDAAADHAALEAAGVTVESLLDFGGGVPPMFVLHDPDGNQLTVVQQPPRS